MLDMDSGSDSSRSYKNSWHSPVVRRRPKSGPSFAAQQLQCSACRVPDRCFVLHGEKLEKSQSANAVFFFNKSISTHKLDEKRPDEKGLNEKRLDEKFGVDSCTSCIAL